MDLFITFRCGRVWSEPTHLGDVVNSPTSDAEARFSPTVRRFTFPVSVASKCNSRCPRKRRGRSRKVLSGTMPLQHLACFLKPGRKPFLVSCAQSLGHRPELLVREDGENLRWSGKMVSIRKTLSAYPSSLSRGTYESLAYATSSGYNNRLCTRICALAGSVQASSAVRNRGRGRPAGGARLGGTGRPVVLLAGSETPRMSSTSSPQARQLLPCVRHYATWLWCFHSLRLGLLRAASGGRCSSRSRLAQDCCASSGGAFHAAKS